MRTSSTLVLLMFFFLGAFAQPPNDNCANATTLSLGTPNPCPSTSPANNTFTYNNNNATPASPYPALTGCSVGGSLEAPAAEVWFSFVATGNITTIGVSGGLNTPNIALATGSDCAFLSWVDCASAEPNDGSVTLVANTLVGQTYFLLVSGGNVNDQGTFTLSFASANNCNPCLLGNNFVANPPPQNGTYSSGQTVTFCFTINQWDVTGTIEWFHAITMDLGPGWDLTTLTPFQIPPSCGNDGFWGFYDSWVGCNTGMTFGPGFAYESSSGVGCGGAPLDGNPGNNWGDGLNGCASIPNGGPPVTFCWSVTVADCPPNTTGNDLSMAVNVWSDGDSGSWTQTGCNSGTTFEFLASAVCCTDLDPIVIPSPTSCPGGTDGSLQIEPGGGIAPPGEVYNIVVFDAANNIIFTCNGCSGQIIADMLPAGTYSVVATNVLSGCARSSITQITDGNPPVANASTFGMPCPGDPILLNGSVTPFDPAATYFWTGPGGFSSTQQNPTNATQEGTYTLVVTINGCQSEPATVDVQFVDLNISANAMPMTICAGNQTTLTASGAATYTWENTTTGEPLGAGSPITATINVPSVITVTGTDINGCSETATVLVDVNPLPTININVTGNLCADNPIVLQATGAQSYLWSDNVNDNPRIVTLPQGLYTFEVTGTDANGCENTASITLAISEPPDGSITPANPIICGGESVTLTAAGGNNYAWSTAQNGPIITVSPLVTTTYQVTVTDFDGCEDVVDVTVSVDQPVMAPDVVCGDITPNSVEFTWDAVMGATGYDVNVVTNQNGTLSGATFSVDNLAPGETVTIEVTAQSGTSCPDATTTISCSAQDCPPVDVEITPVDDICLTADVMPDTLEVTISGGMGGGDTLWLGDAIIDSLLGVFDPLEADTGVNEVIVAYTEGICTYYDTLDINVFAAPSADFTVDNSPICITESVIVTYTGSADTSATYNWNFDGGTADPGTGQGPHDVNWGSPGIKTITLTVIENGCSSEVFSETVEVLEPLPDPVISCGASTTTSVIFEWNDIPGADSYTVNVQTNQSGTLNGTTYTVDNLMPGETVTIEVIAESSSPCGSSSAVFTCNADDCPTFTINIDPVADICLDGTDQSLDLTATVSGGQGNGQLQWSGNGITDADAGTFDPDAAGAGMHTITLTYTEGPCQASETIDINVFETPTSDFTVSPLSVCVNEEVTVTYTGAADENSATFTWNFNGGVVSSGTGAGPYTLSWPGGGMRTITLIVEQDGCSSEQSSQSVEVSTPLAAPVINCSTTTASIIFSWNDVNGADSYNVTVLAGPAGMQIGNTYEVTGLNPGDAVTIEVEAVGSGPCGNSTAQQTCVAEDCPVVSITFDPVADICLDDTAAPVMLLATLSGNTGGGVSTWSGPGITDAMAGTFDPDQAGPGMHTISYNYQEGNCSYNNSLTINVFEQPTADFTADTPVCVDQSADVVYTGTGAASATYNWDFDGGVILSGTGAGPYEISWSTSGPKTISLTVTENGCSSEEFTAIVEVAEPLSVPVVSCATTNTSVTFSWADVPGATGYEVVVIDGPAGTQVGNSYEVTGLDPGDEVTIEVIAQTDSPCGNSSVAVSCTAQDCPTVTIDIAPVADLCTDSDAVTLTATATGGAGGGTYTWAGTGVTDPSGTFDPTAVIAGMHTVTVTYTEGVCIYTASMDISVFAVPTADFTLGGPVCVDETTTVTYTGTATATATYAWDFDGGTILSGTGAGPYEISWATSGPKTVSLTVTEDGCTSEIFTQDIQIDEPLAAPVLSCATTNTSITFSWVDVPGAVGYQVTQLSGPGTGTQLGNSYEVSGLNPGDMVTIEVLAESGGACPNSVAQLECIAQDCPEVSLTIDPVGALCADSEAVTLTATAEGGAGDGTFSWGGSGVSDPSGVFDPTAVIAGTHTVTVVYTEGVCTYSESIDIIVNPVPVAAIELSEGPVCAGDIVTVTFTGTASANAVYSWSFDGGVADPGTGAGPHEVVWSESGMKTVTLMLEDQGCSAGEGALQSIAVESPLAEPQIICEESSSTSITFSWEEIAGATGYEVSVLGGPDGTLTGTTYTIDNLVPEQEVTIQVTALSDGPCPNAVGEGTCIAQDCPALSLALSGTTAVCSGEAADITFDFTGDSEGPFEVSYTLNNGAEQTITLTEGQGLSLEDLTETTVIQVLSITDNSLSDCVYPGNVSWAVQVSQPVEAGIPSEPARVCQGEEAQFNLFDLLEGADLGGQWTEVSGNPSTGGAFNAAGGTFTTTNQTAGTYTFRYTIDAADPCPDSDSEVTVRVEPAPAADAGSDQTLTCNMGLVSLGGTSDPELSYEWTSANPDAVIADPNAPAIDVSHPGIYTLTVSNDIGCTATDEVEVSAELEVPTAEVSVTDISCFEAGDGIITIANVSGGQPAYQYSLNDGAFSGQTVYGGLSPGSYTLIIRDANGCFTELSVDLTEPDELVVSLTTSLEGDDRVIELGDSVRLDAMYNAGIVIDTIMWQPDTLVKGNQASVWVSPVSQTTYRVTVVDANGCRDSDHLTLFVKKDRPVYIPNAFSPNEDGVNDVFYIQSGSQVREVKSFLVFNRWGETMIELYGFQPNDPTYGWDGLHRGQVLNPAVFAWFAEIEFEDGEVILYEGDVVLMR